MKLLGCFAMAMLAATVFAGEARAFDASPAHFETADADIVHVRLHARKHGRAGGTAYRSGVACTSRRFCGCGAANAFCYPATYPVRNGGGCCGLRLYSYRTYTPGYGYAGYNCGCSCGRCGCGYTYRGCGYGGH